MLKNIFLLSFYWIRRNIKKGSHFIVARKRFLRSINTVENEARRHEVLEHEPLKFFPFLKMLGWNSFYNQSSKYFLLLTAT